MSSSVRPGVRGKARVEARSPFRQILRLRLGVAHRCRQALQPRPQAARPSGLARRAARHAPPTATPPAAARPRSPPRSPRAPPDRRGAPGCPDPRPRAAARSLQRLARPDMRHRPLARPQRGLPARFVAVEQQDRAIRPRARRARAAARSAPCPWGATASAMPTRSSAIASNCPSTISRRALARRRRGAVQVEQQVALVECGALGAVQIFRLAPPVAESRAPRSRRGGRARRGSGS
jgi:hypothetical protein